MRKPGKNRENQYVSYPFPPLTTAPIATACSTRTRSFISSNLISLFLSPAVLNLYQRAASRTCRLRAAGIQKMAELAEGDGGKELRVLSGAVYDAGWGI